RGGRPPRDVRTPSEADRNMELGTTSLAALLREFGTTEDALVAYNAGPRAARWMRRNPAARARFVAGYPRDVLQEWRRLLAARPSLSEPHPAVVAEGRLTAPR